MTDTDGIVKTTLPWIWLTFSHFQILPNLLVCFQYLSLSRKLHFLLWLITSSALFLQHLYPLQIVSTTWTLR